MTAEPGGHVLKADNPEVQVLLEQLESYGLLRHPHVEPVLGWGYSDGGDGAGGSGDLVLLTEPYVCGSAAELFARLAAPESRRMLQTSARR